MQSQAETLERNINSWTLMLAMQKLEIWGILLVRIFRIGCSVLAIPETRILTQIIYKTNISVVASKWSNLIYIILQMLSVYEAACRRTLTSPGRGPGMHLASRPIPSPCTVEGLRIVKLVNDRERACRKVVSGQVLYNSPTAQCVWFHRNNSSNCISFEYEISTAKNVYPTTQPVNWAPEMCDHWLATLGRFSPGTTTLRVRVRATSKCELWGTISSAAKLRLSCHASKLRLSIVQCRRLAAGTPVYKRPSI